MKRNQNSSINPDSKEQGITLIEVMVTVVIVGILAFIAAPSFSSFFERQRLVGAASALSSELQFARAEALKTDDSVTVRVDSSPSNEWCIGTIVSTAACTCDDGSGTCVVNNAERIASYNDYPGVTLSSAISSITIDPRRGTLSAQGDIVFSGAGGNALKVDLTKLGRVNLCVSSGFVAGYEDC